MPRLFVANLHFERQIAGDRQTLPVGLAERTAELATCWLPVCESGDRIWCPQPVAPEFWERMSALGLPLVQGAAATADVPAGLDLTPWGWSTAMQQFARRVAARMDAPPLSTVRRANSRRFALELEQHWNCGLDLSHGVTSIAELEQVLRDVRSGERWVLKTEFSSAARERIVCTGPAPDSTSVGWIRKRLAAGAWLCFEPWVERIEEAGIQWTVPKSGAPTLEGVTTLLSDALGQYQGSVFGLTSQELARWEPAIEVTRRAVAELQTLGYFGPVGIDAMQYRDAQGSERLRPLQDINARWTMGRLALGWQRLMPHGTWRHGTVEEFRERQRLGDRIVRTSPETVGNRDVRIANWLE